MDDRRQSPKAGESIDDMVVAEHLSKSYPRRRILRLSRRPQPPVIPALNDVSLRIRRGEMVGLLGPNGAGKTTLLKIISTLLYPSSGTVWVAGHDVCREPGHVRRSIGLITCDERSFYWRLTGRQNLSFFAALYGIEKRTAAVRTAELLETLGLTDAADRRYQEYSSGMKQKLSIARGLLTQPRIVLYDEPTRSLDPLSAANIRRWILHTREQLPDQTHLIATNQLNEAEQLCDRVLIIHRGTVIADGHIAQIRREWQRRNAAIHRIRCRGYSQNGHGFSCDGLLDSRVVCIEDDVNILEIRTIAESDALSSVLLHVLRSGGVVLSCETHQVPFDEVFCSIVQEAEPQSIAAGAR